jgi:hypothetical protein
LLCGPVLRVLLLPLSLDWRIVGLALRAALGRRVGLIALGCGGALPATALLLVLSLLCVLRLLFLLSLVVVVVLVTRSGNRRSCDCECGDTCDKNQPGHDLISSEQLKRSVYRAVPNPRPTKQDMTDQELPKIAVLVQIFA